MFNSRTDRSNQVTHSNFVIWATRWILRLGSNDAANSRLERILSRIWTNYYERGVLYCSFVFPARPDLPQIPFTSIQFPLYEFLKVKFVDVRGRKRGTLPAYEAAMCGSVAGGTAAALTTPLDVLKTRVMLDLRVRAYLFVMLHHTYGPCSRIPRPASSQAHRNDYQRYIEQGVRGHYLLAPFLGRYGYLLAVRSSLVHMNGRSVQCRGCERDAFCRKSQRRLRCFNDNIFGKQKHG